MYRRWQFYDADIDLGDNISAKFKWSISSLSMQEKALGGLVTKCFGYVFHPTKNENACPLSMLIEKQMLYECCFARTLIVPKNDCDEKGRSNEAIYYPHCLDRE